MTQRPTSQRDVTWEGPKGKTTINGIPQALLDAAEAFIPEGHGYKKRVWIALLTLWISESCPQEARELLIEWSDRANRDPELQAGRDIAVRFARAVLEHQEDS
jgi:hypothetical protein